LSFRLMAEATRFGYEAQFNYNARGFRLQAEGPTVLRVRESSKYNHVILE
jgi:hypothetical protein